MDDTDDIFDKLSRGNYFYKLDIKRVYLHFKVDNKTYKYRHIH